MAWQVVGNIKGQNGASGKDAPPVDVQSIVAEVTRLIPAPRDGKSVSLDEVREIVVAEVGKAVAAIPVPKDGKDADPINPETISRMVSEEIARAVAQIPKARDGADGTNGKDADPEIIKALIITEVARGIAALPLPQNGRDGRDAKDGRDGTDGKDAFQIEILDAITPMKTVPRGTVACHAGGLLRARRATTPGESIDLSEWDVLLQGIAETRVTQGEDPRQFRIELKLTGGACAVKEARMPVMIYKGVWREGETYEHGDVVTWGGSGWHCNAEKSTLKPGTPNSPDWTLAIKRGADPRPPQPGPPGPQGPPGKDGRDLTQISYDGRKH